MQPREHRFLVPAVVVRSNEDQLWRKPDMKKRPYFLKYPCFIIENTDGRSIRCLSVEGETCVALFTDADLVQRYLSQGAMSGSLRSFDTPDDLKRYLEAILPHYDRFVPIDPNIAGKGYVGVSISEFLEELDE